MKRAVKLRLLAHNGAKDVEKPAHTAPEMKVFDPDEVARLLAAAKDDRLHALYVLAVDAGFQELR